MTDVKNTDNYKEITLSIGEAAALLAQEFPGVTVSALRFLEGEGLITPARNRGGHRVFSLQDVLRIRRIKQLQAERVPLREIRERIERALSVTDLQDAVDEITRFLLNESIPEAMSRLEDVRLAETPLLTLFDDVLTPVLRNLGDEYGNHIIPVDLQFEFDEQLIAFISRITVTPANIVGRPVVLAACPPWERHDLSLRMLVALLMERGASVHFIGAQVNSEFARDANERLNPAVILVSLTVPPSRLAHKWFDELIASMSPHQKLFVGGMGARRLRVPQSANLQVLGVATYAEMVQLILAGNSGT